MKQEPIVAPWDVFQTKFPKSLKRARTLFVRRLMEGPAKPGDLKELLTRKAPKLAKKSGIVTATIVALEREGAVRIDWSTNAFAWTGAGFAKEPREERTT